MELELPYYGLKGLTRICFLFFFNLTIPTSVLPSVPWICLPLSCFWASALASPSVQNPLPGLFVWSLSQSSGLSSHITFSRKPSWPIPSKGGLHSYYAIIFVFFLFFLPCLFPSEHFQNMNVCLFIYLLIFCFFLLSLNNIPSLHSVLGTCLSITFVTQYGTSGRFLNTHPPSSSSNGLIAIPLCLHCTISLPHRSYGVELLSPCYQWRNSFRGLDDLLKATQPLRSDGDRIWAHVCLVLKPSLFLPCCMPQSLDLRGAGRNVEKA